MKEKFEIILKDGQKVTVAKEDVIWIEGFQIALHARVFGDTDGGTYLCEMRYIPAFMN